MKIIVCLWAHYYASVQAFFVSATEGINRELYDSCWSLDGEFPWERPLDSGARPEMVTYQVTTLMDGTFRLQREPMGWAREAIARLIGDEWDPEKWDIPFSIPGLAEAKAAWARREFQKRIDSCKEEIRYLEKEMTAGKDWILPIVRM